MSRTTRYFNGTRQMSALAYALLSRTPHARIAKVSTWSHNGLLDPGASASYGDVREVNPAASTWNTLAYLLDDRLSGEYPADPVDGHAKIPGPGRLAMPGQLPFAEDVLFAPFAQPYDVGAEYLVVLDNAPLTYSDYSGSTVERSNVEALTRDYPDTFITLTGHYGATSLAIPLMVLAEDREHLSENNPHYDGEYADDPAQILVDLIENYPLYDEEHHSALEMELVDEAFESYQGDDLLDDLSEELTDWTVNGRELELGVHKEDIEAYIRMWLESPDRWGDIKDTYLSEVETVCEDATGTVHFANHSGVVSDLCTSLGALLPSPETMTGLDA